MKITSILILTAVCGAPLIASAAEDATELERVREKVAATFDEIDPAHVQASPVPGWYTIRKGTLVGYISADGKYLLQGELIDLDRDVNLTEETRNGARLALMSRVPDERAIVFSPKKVKHTVSVFTDVYCTFCRRFHSQIDEYLAQGIEVRYLLYPRDGPNSRAWKTAERVWCAADRKKALTLAKLDRDFESKRCDASIVQDHFELGHEVGLRGTPALVLEDGSLISGYVPPAELSRRAAEAAANSATAD
ncbi:MAG TPA: DsbC family protein [Woeseiaceae bacterium]|nr:DsbC family protein [Woeseiaceae bacterium]